MRKIILATAAVAAFLIGSFTGNAPANAKSLNLYDFTNGCRWSHRWDRWICDYGYGHGWGRGHGWGWGRGHGRGHGRGEGRGRGGRGHGE